MGSGIGKETINIVNNQFNAAKEHLTQTLEQHKDSFLQMTIMTLVFMAIAVMIFYACGRFCLQKLRRSMGGKKAEGLPYYATRAQYAVDPIIRYKHRAEEMDDPSVESNEERRKRFTRTEF